MDGFRGGDRACTLPGNYLLKTSTQRAHRWLAQRDQLLREYLRNAAHTSANHLGKRKKEKVKNEEVFMCWGGKIAHSIHFLRRFKSPNYSFGMSFVDVENIVLATVHTQSKNMLNSGLCVFVSLPYRTDVFSHSALIE